MSLKGTLAARTVSKNQEKDQKKNLEADFKRNFQNLYKNFSGAWLSFGDERLAREALMDMANTLVGRELIASLPEDLDIGSTNFLPRFAAGHFSEDKNEISFNTNIFSSDPSKKARYIRTISHELRHAVQKKKGLSGENKGLSAEQFVITGKLREAETRAWDDVLIASAVYLDGEKYGDRKKLKEFLEKNPADLIKPAKMVMEESGQKFDEKYYCATYAPYLLHAALKEEMAKCKNVKDLRPIIYAAQKKVVAQKMKILMNLPENAEAKDIAWRDMYDKQAIGNTEHHIKENNITSYGNDKEFNKILDYYHKEYGLKHSDIDQMDLSPENKKAYDALMQRSSFEKADKKYRPVNQANIIRNNRGR